MKLAIRESYNGFHHFQIFYTKSKANGADVIYKKSYTVFDSGKVITYYNRLFENIEFKNCGDTQAYFRMLLLEETEKARNNTNAIETRIDG